MMSWRTFANSVARPGKVFALLGPSGMTRRAAAVLLDVVPRIDEPEAHLIGGVRTGWVDPDHLLDGGLGSEELGRILVQPAAAEADWGGDTV